MYKDGFKFQNKLENDMNKEKCACLGQKIGFFCQNSQSLRLSQKVRNKAIFEISKCKLSLCTAALNLSLKKIWVFRYT